MNQIVTDTKAPPRPFTHLHCHSHYSLLDGAGDIGKLVNRCVEHGMNSLALTDHGNLHGAPVFTESPSSWDQSDRGYEKTCTRKSIW